MQAPSWNPQIRRAIFCCQIAMLAWSQPAVGNRAKAVLRQHRACPSTARRGHARLSLTYISSGLVLFFGLGFFYDTWKIRIKSWQKYLVNFSIFKLPVQQVLRKLTSAGQRAELWVYSYAFNFTPWLEREKIGSWRISLSKPILSQSPWKEVRSFHPLQRAADQPVTLQTGGFHLVFWRLQQSPITEYKSWVSWERLVPTKQFVIQFFFGFTAAIHFPLDRATDIRWQHHTV